MKTLKKLRNIALYINNHPLAGKHRLLSYWKVVQWQMRQLISPGEKKIRFLGNTYLMVNKGMTGATGNIYMGLHEFNEMGFLLHFLRTDDVFADVGANVGSYTVLASGYCKARTIAIEPGPQAFQQLNKNVMVNHIEPLVRVMNIGAGSSKTKLLFTNSYDTVNHIVPESERENEEVVIEIPVMSLDEIFDGVKAPTLIKIDVEGFETEVISGMSLLMESKDLKAIIIELNGSGWRYGYDENEIHKKLLQNGFQPYEYNPLTRDCSLINNYGQHNTIYLRDIEYVNARLKMANKVSLFSETF